MTNLGKGYIGFQRDYRCPNCGSSDTAMFTDPGGWRVECLACSAMHFRHPDGKLADEKGKS